MNVQDLNPSITLSRPVLTMWRKPWKSPEEAQQARENTSQAIKSTSGAIVLVSLQEVLAKCYFLATPTPAQQRFVLYRRWAHACVCCPLVRVGHSRVSRSIIDFPCSGKRERPECLQGLMSCPANFQTTRTCVCARQCLSVLTVMTRCGTLRAYEC